MAAVEGDSAPAAEALVDLAEAAVRSVAVGPEVAGSLLHADTMTTNRINRLLAFHAQDPEDPFVRFALASEYLKKGDEQAALEWFEELAADQPDYVGTYYHLGKLYESLGRKDDALATYRSGIQIAQRSREFQALSELQDLLLNAEGVGFDD